VVLLTGVSGEVLGPGARVGPYVLEEMLGQGAMGVVYRAEHELHGHAVALKILRESLSENDLYRRRFEREARVATEVEHENLVPILEAGEMAGRHYLAARYVSGRTLAARLDAEGPLAVEDVLRLVGELGAGLDALHHRGIVHRDVKPSNVMLDEDGRAMLTDFGLAKGPAYTVLTKPGQLVGTVDYIAPELVRGEAASPASDLYALGCLVFACIAGTPPFAATNPFEVTVAHLGEDPPDPCAARQDAPAGLGAAVLEALAKEPASRPRSARAYALGLWLAARPR
jgi:serine/threonine protein kinase